MPKRNKTHGRGVLSRVESLARNLWWTWNPAAKRLMESLEPSLFEATRGNPIATIARLPRWRGESIERDSAFALRVADIEREQALYLAAKTWHQRAAKGDQRSMLTAYFCMEYALHESLPLYAGGLGVLAGDLLKSASDLGVPLVAIGVLWKRGYYRQELGVNAAKRSSAERIDVLYPEADFNEWPVIDTRKRASVEIGGRDVQIRIWRLDVGRVPLYLLDTDINENAPADRALTHHLYKGGDPEYRIRQEILLGIGGLAALDALGIDPDVFHLNEGHAAFLPLERVRRLVDAGAPFETAKRLVKQSSVFTTHTPVPEGNDRFPAAQVMRHFAHWPKELGIGRDEFLALGRENPADEREWFCMTVLALKLAERCNGVAKLHGETARKMWKRVLEDPDAAPLSIGHVTNGVHPQTWLGDEAVGWYERRLKAKWLGTGPDHDPWARVKGASDKELWELRQSLRSRMIREARMRLRKQLIRHSGGNESLHALDHILNEDALTIGFARRFALYKRGTLLFHDLNRLRRIVSSADRPVQFFFAGKAHPIDEAGHELVRTVMRMMHDTGLLGRVWILEDYGLDIGRLLTAGCDVWLNTPLRPMEASGTSGMKGPLNGAINCSVLDGWWAEACDDGVNGWAIGAERTSSPERVERLPRAKRDKLDAQSLYETLERRVVPLFYKRDRRGIPRGWVKMMRASMRTLGARFSTHRMVAEYVRDYYWPAMDEG